VKRKIIHPSITPGTRDFSTQASRAIATRFSLLAKPD
jgi:hypothetical protein